MANELAPLRAMEYPGRLIVLVRSRSDRWLIGYAITGRSPSSRARRLVVKDAGRLDTEPSDPAVLRTGNPALLVYPAVMASAGGLVVSNGAQTTPICGRMSGAESASACLEAALATPTLVAGIDVTAFEPDAPNYTPRISGCVLPGKAALAIVRRDDAGAPSRQVFDVTATPVGSGWLLSTYAGTNTNPLPAFAGGPVALTVDADDPDVLVEAIYAALAPAPGKDDLRVAAAATSFPGAGEFSVINRVDL